MAVPRPNSAPIQEPQEETHLIYKGVAAGDDAAAEDEGFLSPSQMRDRSELLSRPLSLLLLIGPALLAGIVVKAFDIGFLNTSYARLASNLHHFKDAAWIVLTDSICSAFCVPLYSYLLKSFGVHRMTLVAFGSFATGLGLCAISSSFGQLLTSRFVVGLGSSGITLLSMIIINDIVGIKLFPLWESFITCIETATVMAAGPLGAFIFRSISWNSVFYLELTLAVIALSMLHFSFKTLKSHPYGSRLSFLSSGNSNVASLDVFGWILLILAVTIPLLALTLGDNLLPWSHPLEIVLLVSAPILMGTFIYFEAKVATNPVIDMKPIFKVEYLKVLLQVFSVISTFNVIVFAIPPYIEVRSFDDDSFGDWALTCVITGLPAGAILGGYLIKAGTFSVQRIMLANAVVLEVFTMLFLTRAIKPELVEFSPLLAGFGLCIGVWQSSLLYATLSSTQKEWWSQNLALYYLIETFGADLGVALMSSIIQSRAKSGIRAGLGQSAAVEKIILDAMENLESVRLLDEFSRQQVLSAYEQAMHLSFFLPCTLAAAVIFLAATMVVNPTEAFSEDAVETREII